MATLNLKGITKIYPHSGGQKKPKKGAPEKKTNLQVTDKGVVAVQLPRRRNRIISRSSIRLR